MPDTSSIALPESQAALNCGRKAELYNAEMTFAKRVLMARERRGWTQDQLAANFGITKQAVYAWEKDKDKPTFEKLPRLAEVLQVPIRWLLAGSGEPPEVDDLESLIDALTTAQRTVLIGLIETFLSAEPAKRQARQ